MTTDIEHDWEIRRAQTTDAQSLVSMRLRLDDHMARANPRLLLLSTQGRDALSERYRQELLTNLRACLWPRVGRLRRFRAAVREDLVPSHGRIDDVRVEPSFRRQGICRAMLRQLLVFFERKGVQLLDLYYTIGNAQAEYAWHGLGFRPVLNVAAQRWQTLKQLEPGAV